ncbi:MAG: mRNA surveillance protein pelota, partial [archaeon]|nr:mRNA surveillance protein pelota [archaeon]
TDDDIWHLYNIIEAGDFVTASTTRRGEQISDKIRSDRVEKKRMTLGILTEKIELSDDNFRIKILGTIKTGPQDIGQHHTLIIEIGSDLKITKKEWKVSHIKRLERAVSDTTKSRIVFISLDRDEATIAVMRQSGLKEICTIHSLKCGKQYDTKNDNEYHNEIIEKLKSIMEKDMPLVVLGPGFEKELLIEDGKYKSPETFSKCFVYHTGQCGMQGINELMKKGMGASFLRESRVGIEMEAVEKLMEEIGKDGPATYGLDYVNNAAMAGAVDTLLIVDSKLKNGSYDTMIRNIEAQKGNIIVVSGQHDAGKELESLGGFAAILRYKINEKT